MYGKHQLTQDLSDSMAALRQPVDRVSVACVHVQTANYMSFRWRRVTTRVERAASVVLRTARAHLAVCALGSEGRQVARFPARQSVANSLL